MNAENGSLGVFEANYGFIYGMKSSSANLSSWLTVLVCYLLCFVLMWALLSHSPESFSPVIWAFCVDCAATLLVFGFSLFTRNASMYDAYWSVIPMIFTFFWANEAEIPWTFSHICIVSCVWFWGFRLTLNWAKGWRGLSHEDWRYVQLREENPTIYTLINFSGIHLFPTILVFLGMLPLFFALGQSSFSLPVLLAGCAIMLGSTLLEYAADEQMRRFRANSSQAENCETGLWEYSRHPNYLGEIGFWFGSWLCGLSAGLGLWWTGIGWICMLLLFVFISIPLMEKHNLQRRPGYKEYIKRVPMLIPFVR